MVHYKKASLDGIEPANNITPEYSGQIYVDTRLNTPYVAGRGDSYDSLKRFVPYASLKGVSNILWEYTFDSNQSEIYIPESSLGIYNIDLEIDFINATATDLMYISAFINDETNNNDYRSAHYNFNDSSTSDGTYSWFTLGHGDGSNIAKFFSKIRFVNGKYWLLTTTYYTSGTGYVRIRHGIAVMNKTLTEPIRKLKLYTTTTSSGATAFAPGTRIRISDPYYYHYNVDVIRNNDEIEISDAIDGNVPPSSITTITSGNGSVNARKFDPSTDEDVLMNWNVPDNFYGDKISVAIEGVITEPTVPTSNEGISFEIKAFKVSNGENLNGSFNTPVNCNISDLNGYGCDTQYDLFVTNYEEMTIDNILSGDDVIFCIKRNTTHADDDYGQDIGIIKLLIKYDEE
ncbi:MAG: hypothetical protein BV456_06835 [Thermoplasmata archaeon M8B2D]|nr:MAG: hypothetical protein BV456_06835 [Thermoplasmata archaeon M8B2D]